MSNKEVMITTNKKPVCCTDTLNLTDFENMTLEEQLNLIATGLVVALCGSNYKRQYDRYI